MILKYKPTFQIFSSLLINHNNDLTLSSEDLDYETEHEHRKRELNKGDSVYTVDLREFFQSQIQNLYGQVKQNYNFQKQRFLSSVLLAWSKYTGQKLLWGAQQASFIS